MSEVSTRVFPFLLTAAREAGLDVGRLVDGLDFSERELRDPRQRVAWDDYAEFLARLEEGLGGPEALSKLGEKWSDNPGIRFVKRPLRVAADIHTLVTLNNRWFGPHLFSTVHAQAEWLSDTQARIDMRIEAGRRDSPQFFRLAKAAYSDLPTVIGEPRAEVDLTLGDHCCSLLATFSRDTSFRARLRRLQRRARARRPFHDELVRQQGELRETIQALKESERRYRLLVEQSGVLIWRFDVATRRLTDMSIAVRDVMGYEPDEVVQMNLDELTVAEDMPIISQGIADMLEGRAERLAVEVRQIRKDRQIIWCEIHAAAIRNAEGKVTAIQGVTHDISARKEAEAERIRALAAEEARDRLASEIEERKRVEAELVRARDAAREAERLKSSILANLSHEIRTPLTGLIGFGEVLARRLQGTELEAGAAVIHRSGRRLLSLLNNMLDLARLEAGKMPMEPASYPLGQTLGHVVALLRPQAEEKGLRLEVDLDDGLFLHSDARRDEQVFLNIVGNAVRYTEKGLISITAMEDSDGFCLITVADTGVGMSEAFLPHAFEEFRQESEGLSRVHEGSGLGLALSRRLLEAMGGRISIESVKEQGTTVRIWLPLARKADREKADSMPEAEAPR